MSSRKKPRFEKDHSPVSGRGSSGGRGGRGGRGGQGSRGRGGRGGQGGRGRGGRGSSGETRGRGGRTAQPRTQAIKKASATAGKPPAILSQDRIKALLRTVDMLCPQRETMRVVTESDNEVWSVCLQKDSEMFLIQLLENVEANTKGAPYYSYGLWLRWGPDEEKSRIEKYPTVVAAKEKFKDYFKKLTRIVWEGSHTFRKVVLNRHKYMPVVAVPPRFSLDAPAMPTSLFEALGEEEEGEGEGEEEEEESDGIPEFPPSSEGEDGSDEEGFAEEEEGGEEFEEEESDDETGAHRLPRDPFTDDGTEQAAVGNKRDRRGETVPKDTTEGTGAKQEEGGEEEENDSECSDVVDNDEDYINLCASKVEKKVDSADAWFDLALALVDGCAAATMVNDKIVTVLECHVKAVELAEPNDGDSWCNLGATMNRGDKVVVREQEMDQVAVRAKAAELLGDEAADAWNNLGFALALGQKVTVGGKEYDKFQCCLKAISIDSESAPNFDTLGTALFLTDKANPGKEAQVTVKDRPMKANDCFLRALSLDREYSWAWLHLGLWVRASKGSQETAKIHFRGKEYSEIDCFKAAIGEDPEDADEFAADVRQVEPETAELLLELKLIREISGEERQEHQQLLQGIRPELPADIAGKVEP